MTDRFAALVRRLRIALGICLVGSLWYGCSGDAERAPVGPTEQVFPSPSPVPTAAKGEPVQQQLERHFAGILSALSGPVPERSIVPDLPFDAIPPLPYPNFIGAAAALVAPDDWVLGVYLEGEAYAYPINILNFHEIATHQIGQRRIIVTYCPLTNSGALIEGTDHSFGNTGALYNNNVVMYDTQTRSFWSQMALGCIFGERAGEHLDLMPIVQTTWESWQRLFPNTRVLSEHTGYSRNYQVNPYRAFEYDRNTDIFFPQETPIDRRLHPKQMVYGLARKGEALAYPYDLLGQRDLANHHFAGRDILILFDGEAQMAVGFERALGDRRLDFALLSVPADGPPLFTDSQTGSTWNIMGFAIDGPLAGQQLTPIAAYSAYWFGWAGFWPNSEIWDGQDLVPTVIEE
ncbi:MAG: DUF3179 domain-containing protein [Candidatus Latescibacteria bacterium]|nr:DUF3179 domain-containing protein [Candidatus Latescibacterota bacterium]